MAEMTKERRAAIKVLALQGIAGAAWLKEECLTLCSCFDHPKGCGECLADGAVPDKECNACGDDGDGASQRCALARLEADLILTRLDFSAALARAEKAENSLAAHREALEEVIKQACGHWCDADCGNPNDERMPAYCAWGKKARLAMSPDPGQAIVARLKAGEALAKAWDHLWREHPESIPAPHRAEIGRARAAYDKAVGSQPEPDPVTDQATAAETQTVPERELREAIRGLRGEIGGTRIYLSPAVLLLPEPKLDEFLAGILENVMRIAREMREKRAREEGTPAND